MTYRNPSLLKHAQFAPYCMGCGKHNDGTIVACHSNRQRDGKGFGHKAHDYRVAYCCFECHNKIDQENDRELWESAHRNTVGYWFDAGILKCN